MIYLTTGANGAGKTLVTLRDVREQQLKENRPVYYHGFIALQPLKDFGWLPFEPEKWMDLPDGSILVFDEAQNDFPLRRSGAEVPKHIADIAQFRRARGFDFWIITPHPSLLDVFIRRLIDNPSWHRHLKRVAGSQMVSVIKWNAVNTTCEKAGSGASGEISVVAYPKEVFDWYQSATMHTAKVKLPRWLWYTAGAIVAVLALGGFIVYRGLPKSEVVKHTDAQSTPVTLAQAAPAASRQKEKPGALTGAEYVEARTPRIAGLVHTAPAYDGVVAPSVAPYPAACIDGVRRGTKQRECICYTQQATRLQTPDQLCQQIAANGFFIDWKQETHIQPATKAAVSPAVESGPTMHVIGQRALDGRKAEPRPANATSPAL